MTKKELREKYKELRKNFTTADVEDKSIEIANQLLKLDIWAYSYYHVFLPIASKNEVDTEFILHILQGKDKHIVISKSDFEDNSLEHFLLTDQTKLVINEWGIPEPESNSIPIPDSSIEVVFVPLLAYDKKGSRVGYGKGFYDRFLNKCKPELTIGLSFFEPEKKLIEAGEHDVSLDFCVYPGGTSYFK